MYKNTPKTFYMGGATPTDMTMVNRGVFFITNNGGGGGTYYAYTDSNSNTIYTKNALADAGTFTLQNATINGTLTQNNGIYSGFSRGNYFYINTAQPQHSFELIIRCNRTALGSGTLDLLRTQPDGKGILMRMYNSVPGSVGTDVYISSSGNGWNTLVGFNVSFDISTEDKFTYLKTAWNDTSGQYVFSQSNDKQNWAVKATSSSGLPAPYWSGNNQTIGGCSSYSEAWNYGLVDMPESQLTVDGVTTKYGSITGASTLYDSNLSPLSAQPRFTVSSGNIVINNVTYTRNSSADITQ